MDNRRHAWGTALLAALIAVFVLGVARLAAAQIDRTPLPSTDAYLASLAYAKCMRAHGVPHPNPDRRGDFNLTPADEQRLRSVPKRARRAADDACFHHLKGLNLRPLSARAIAEAKKVLAELRGCLRARGYLVGPPTVRNLGRGRAFFGFKDAPEGVLRSAKGARVQHVCERRVRLGPRLSKIIAADRAKGPNV